MSKIFNLSNARVVQNKGIKYSELINTFVEPFEEAFSETYIEDVIEFAITAWNFGNIKHRIPADEFEKIINTKSYEINQDIALLNKMIDYKILKFQEYTNFIVDFELKGSDEDPILSIITQEEEAYLANMVQDFESSLSAENSQENYIDRMAIILKPKSPLIDWCKNLNSENTHIEDELKEVSIYLIDDMIDDPEKWLKKKFDVFFKMELEEWSLNKKEWPQKRTYTMFQQWFRVEISDAVYDMEKKPVLKLM